MQGLDRRYGEVIFAWTCIQKVRGRPCYEVSAQANGIGHVFLCRNMQIKNHV